MWLVSAWTSLIQFSGGKLRRLEFKNKSIAGKAEEWIENKDAYSLVLRFLCFLMVALLGTLSFFIIEKMRQNWPFYQTSAVAGFATLLIVACGEMISRILTTKFEFHLLYATMPFIKLLRFTLLAPLVMLVEMIHSKFEKTDSGDDPEGRVSAEDEIMSLVESELEEENGSSGLEEEEKRMIKGIFDIDKMFVREIMTPRVDLVAIPATASLENALKTFIDSGHSRIPLFNESVDNICGVLLAKDFLDKDRISKLSLQEIAHKPVFIPETKAVDDLLAELKKTRNHFAVVIDEYGGTAGIITLEDIIEEIIGEVQDEYDSPEDNAPEYNILGDGSAIFQGRMLISDVNEIFDCDISEDGDADTIGGLVCAELGRIPETGEELTLNNELKITILKADKRKIIRLRISKTDVK